jgi:hypothetical protein
VNGAYDHHFKVRHVSRTPDHIERPFGECFKVKIPAARPGGHDQPRDAVLPVVRMDQITVRAVRQMLVAKDNLKGPLRENFFCLRAIGTDGYVHAERFESINQRVTSLEVRGNDQGSNSAAWHRFMLGCCRLLAKKREGGHAGTSRLLELGRGKYRLGANACESIHGSWYGM